jgi:hypothetical protein
MGNKRAQRKTGIHDGYTQRTSIYSAKLARNKGGPEEIKQNSYFNIKQMPTDYKRRIQSYPNALFGIENSDTTIGPIFR